jgi:acyl-CoA thioester hydrolase
VASLQVDYKVQIPYEGQSVRVGMWTDRVRAASFLIHYELHTGPADSDPVAVVAQTQMVPYDLAAGRPRRLTDIERAFRAHWADTPEEEQGRDNGSRGADNGAATGTGSVGTGRAAAVPRPPGSG